MEHTYKILVLSDLTNSADKTVKSAVAIAKIVNADIDFLYVKKPSEVVDKDSQLSAIRTINKTYFTVDKKIKNLISPIAKSYNTSISHSFVIGNIKNEIEEYIDKNKPDIIVLGKQKTTLFPFLGDNIIRFVLKKHKGTVFIADDKSGLEPGKDFSLGVLQNKHTSNIFQENIINATQKPLTYFKIAEKDTSSKNTPSLESQNKMEYIFEQGDNAIKNISKYLLKKKINVLFVSRQKNHINSKKTSITDIIKSINCSLIVTN
jgi:nucleotide-binding universal stress UspA family protein